MSTHETKAETRGHVQWELWTQTRKKDLLKVFKSLGWLSNWYWKKSYSFMEYSIWVYMPGHDLRFGMRLSLPKWATSKCYFLVSRFDWIDLWLMVPMTTSCRSMKFGKRREISVYLCWKWLFELILFTGEWQSTGKTVCDRGCCNPHAAVTGGDLVVCSNLSVHQ